MVRLKPTLPLLGCALLLSVAGCGPTSGKKDSTHVAPAKIEKLPLETELATITLTADAVRRLGIQTQPMTRAAVSPKRLLSGEALVPLGKSIVVSAPVPGVVARNDGRAIPMPGVHVEPGDAVLALVPLLSPERDVPTPAEQVQLVGARANLVAAQTIARGDVERSRAEVAAAKITLQRAEQLFQDRAGTRKAVDDAQAQQNIAESVFEAATQREKELADLLELLKGPSSNGDAVALPLHSPIGGIVKRLDVSEGQTVASGSVLFEVVNLDTIWIRVPVFVDLLPSIQTDQNASLVSLSGDQLNALDQGRGSRAARTIEARPVTAPPTADALTSSADLYYEVDNRQLGLRPGQRIGVDLPLRGASEALVAPYASVLFDIYGGAWVYVVSGERQYTRHRISIRWVAGEQAVLESGPEVGQEVVVAGAAELFGAEFGAGK